MKRYKVQVTETLQRIVEVEAEDGHEAWEIVKGRHTDEAIVLDAEDFTDLKIEVI